MSIRHFSGRVFFNDTAINLKIGGPVSDDGQQTVIAMDESTHSVCIIRCNVDDSNFQQLAQMVRDHMMLDKTPPVSSPEPSVSRHH
jgi:hypothetical protein